MLAEELINKIWCDIPFDEKLKMAIIEEAIERLRRKSILRQELPNLLVNHPAVKMPDLNEKSTKK